MNREHGRAPAARSPVSTSTAACLLILIIACTIQITRSSIEYSMSEKKYVKHLHENDWQRILDGEWMVEFYSPQCPACKKYDAIWQRFAKSASHLGVNVAKVDITKEHALQGRFSIGVLPTILHVKDGEFRLYHGPIDRNSLMYWLEQKPWQGITPISKWKQPNTVHMSMLSWMFKASYALQDFNGRLQAKYGIPIWASYALLAICTISVGTVVSLAGSWLLVHYLSAPNDSENTDIEANEDSNADNNTNDASLHTLVCDFNDEECFQAVSHQTLANGIKIYGREHEVYDFANVSSYKSGENNSKYSMKNTKSLTKQRSITVSEAIREAPTADVEKVNDSISTIIIRECKKMEATTSTAPVIK